MIRDRIRIAAYVCVYAIMRNNQNYKALETGILMLYILHCFISPIQSLQPCSNVYSRFYTITRIIPHHSSHMLHFAVPVRSGIYKDITPSGNTGVYF